ncbi:hypothetical protein [Klebsiella pneumoniae]|uniref:hypothetical protein n=1 Tax=Klebsiella pneumoniae TaxID=573 RepID=UPI000D749321|nr:hypothetical protein DMR02_20280 [Klebsiella pneumoniae]
MSKKKNRKKASPTPLAPVQPQVAGAASFGYDEMLSELEAIVGNDSNLLIVFYVQIMPDDFVMQLHRF